MYLSWTDVGDVNSTTRTASLVSHVPLACKLSRTLAPLVEQLQQYDLHILVSHDLE